jgi:hypothetical protein
VAAMAGPIFATLLVIAMLVAANPEDSPRKVVSRTAVVAVSAPVLLGLGLFALILTRTEVLLARLQSSPRDPVRAIALYTASIRAALPGAGEDLYSSRRLATLCGAGTNPAIQAACVQVSQQAAARATATADNPPNAWYNLAMFSAEQNDPSKVESSLRTAIREAPHWFKPHWALANLLALTRRMPEARHEASVALELDPKDRQVSRRVADLTESRR